MDGPYTICYDVLYRLAWQGAAQLRASGDPGCCCCSYITKCTQNTYIIEITHGRHGPAIHVQYDMLLPGWEKYRVGNLSPAMGRGIDSRNQVWNWVAKLHRLAGRYDNPMPTWFLAPIAGRYRHSVFSTVELVSSVYISLKLRLHVPASVHSIGKNKCDTYSTILKFSWHGHGHGKRWIHFLDLTWIRSKSKAACRSRRVAVLCICTSNLYCICHLGCTVYSTLWYIIIFYICTFRWPVTCFAFLTYIQ